MRSLTRCCESENESGKGTVNERGNINEDRCSCSSRNSNNSISISASGGLDKTLKVNNSNKEDGH